MKLKLSLFFVSLFSFPLYLQAQSNACLQMARSASNSCQLGVASDFALERGTCLNLESASERNSCLDTASETRQEEQEICLDQFPARREVCTRLDENRYNPVIDPANFVTTVDNPYFPLTPGTTYFYAGQTEDGQEEVEVTVTSNTKVIMGVTCVEVRDTEKIDGVVVEDTLDWFAQDKDGNVWYFGEDTKEFENGQVVSVEGSFQAGVNGAQPGIIMKGDPKVGNVYRQEFYLGNAEDIGEVLGLNETVTVPAGAFTGVLKTKDTNPIEPDVLENKFYARGVGVILEIDTESDERVELIRIERP